MRNCKVGAGVGEWERWVSLGGGSLAFGLESQELALSRTRSDKDYFSRGTRSGFSKSSLKHLTSIRVILSNQKPERALTSSPKAFAPTDSSCFLATSGTKTAGSVNCRHQLALFSWLILTSPRWHVSSSHRETQKYISRFGCLSIFICYFFGKFIFSEAKTGFIFRDSFQNFRLIFSKLGPKDNSLNIYCQSSPAQNL